MITKVFVTCVVFLSALLGGAWCLNCTTQWFDRDDPSGNGDYEVLSNLRTEYPGLICPNPIGIEAQTLSGQPASQTGNVFQVFDVTNGFACVNAEQKGQECVDYRVRFICPEAFCSRCTTQWFDRDDPSGNGDYEVLSNLRTEYPGLICPNPIGIEVQTLSGQPASQTGNVFQVFDVTNGFACVNAEQKGQECVDYRVRFICPEAFCSSCTTQWFDRDDPSGNGDYEVLSNLRTEYPGLICPNPIGIEVQTLSGQPASQTGNVFQLFDVTNGFACVNAEQKGQECVDYRVRFNCPEAFCSRCTTQWFDRDDPSGNGDYEVLSNLRTEYPGLICPNPIGIEVQTLSGQPASQTGNVFQVFDVTNGFACVNAEQKGQECVDYRVRFICPEAFCSRCTTQWFDRDDPSGYGDYEVLSNLRTEYPGLICPNPIGIEVQTLSGQPASQTGNIFQLFDVTNGFACVNAEQKGQECVDYRVRFICPEAFCSRCTTQWFDRDDPSGYGDYEVLSNLRTEYPGLICPNPIGIEVQTLSGQPASQTGNVFQLFDVTNGFACVNAEQKGQECVDYRVRFNCPEAFCSRCTTQWFDRDDPSGNGDYEELSNLRTEYPGLICPNPIGIEVQTLSGQPASQTGNVFQLFDVTNGFACVNAEQKGQKCVDYRVRFNCPEAFCSNCTTQWFDRDDPSGNGDYEVLSNLRTEYPGLICPNPIGIEVQTLSGQPASQTGNVFQVFDVTNGFACVNAEQKGQECVDYRVRFNCPEAFCSRCTTQWFDRDDPSGYGDYEVLSNLRTEYPGLICPNPIGIEVQTLSGQPASQTGNVFQVFDVTNGFACVNAEQKGQECVDYRVRFNCPEAFCSRCTTQWFDRDDPSGNGDYEVLSLLRTEYPGLICPNPIGIDVQTLSGQPASQTGNIFQLFDVTNGFACVNAEQKGQKCVDYRVRFNCPEAFCSNCTTQWFDRDDPSGNGDYEVLSLLRTEYPGLICPNPIGIEVQTLSGQPASQTGNVFQLFDVTNGFACVNAEQKGQECVDYRVRFICPEAFCSSCTTQWFDRDDPSGNGDYEVLSLLRTEYPGLICPNPIGIEVQTLSGQPASQTGNVFQLFDVTNGFACVNAEQKGQECVDYRVRFICPGTFCSNKTP